MDEKINYATALRLAKGFADYQHFNFQDRVKVKTEERFRVDLNTADISFNTEDSILIVRSCIQRLSGPKRNDLIKILPQLSKTYVDEIAGGYLEYDDTAMEVDGIKPNRLNLRMDFKDKTINQDEFNDRINKMNIAAVKWCNKYFLPVINGLNKVRDEK